MYSIYIVDDEMPIVQRLVNSIPWLEHGFEVVGFNTNVHTAISEITEKKPDVVFTDLKMPGCDGLALISYSWCRYEFEDCVPGEYIYRLELLDQLHSHPESVNYLSFMDFL